MCVVNLEESDLTEKSLSLHISKSCPTMTKVFSCNVTTYHMGMAMKIVRLDEDEKT